MSTKTIVLKSSDGKTFEIEEATARQCQTIALMIDENDYANEAIPLPDVRSNILALVTEYCKMHHVDDAKTSSDEDLKKWDEQFMEIDPVTLLDLDSAATYLNIKSLSDLTNQMISLHLRK